MLRPTARLLSWSGMLKKSSEVIKQQTKFAVSFGVMKDQNQDQTLIDFREPDAIDSCKVFCDAELGGFSTVSMTKPDGPEGNYARFAGNISLELPPKRPEVQRSGYAAWRTKDQQRTLWGQTYWDLQQTMWLGMRVKSDGSKYFVNLMAKTIDPADIFQHRLFATKGKWETIYIPFHDFVRTNYGQLVEPHEDIDLMHVKSIGIGLIDRVPGPFELLIEKIWATDKAPYLQEDPEDMPEPGEKTVGVRRAKPSAKKDTQNGGKKFAIGMK